MMDAAAVSPPRPAGSERLLAHCLARSEEAALPRVAASERLEALLGQELAVRLLYALSPRER